MMTRGQLRECVNTNLIGDNALDLEYDTIPGSELNYFEVMKIAVFTRDA